MQLHDNAPRRIYVQEMICIGLHESLCQEILKQGLSPEHSTIEQLYEASNAIEEATRHHQGTRRMDGMGNAQSTAPQVMVPKMMALNQPVQRGPPMA